MEETITTIIGLLVSFFDRIAANNVKATTKTLLTNELKANGLAHLKASDMVKAYETNAAKPDDERKPHDKLAADIVHNAFEFIRLEQAKVADNAELLRKVAELEAKLASAKVKPELTEEEKAQAKAERARLAFDDTDASKVAAVAERVQKDGASLEVSDGQATLRFNHDATLAKQNIVAFAHNAQTGEAFQLVATLSKLNPQKAINLIVAAKLGNANKIYDKAVFSAMRRNVLAELGNDAPDMAIMRSKLAPYIETIETESGAIDFKIRDGVDYATLKDAIAKAFKGTRKPATATDKADKLWAKGKPATATQKAKGDNGLPALKEWAMKLANSQRLLESMRDAMTNGERYDAQGNMALGNYFKTERNYHEAYSVVARCLAFSGEAEPILRDKLVASGLPQFSATFTVTEGHDAAQAPQVAQVAQA